MNGRSLRALLAVTLLPVALGAGANGAPAAARLDVPMSDADRRHLLARTGIGVAAEDYAALAGLTRREGVERTLAGLATAPTLPMPGFTRRPLPHYHARGDMDEIRRRAFDRARDTELAELRRWWVAEMLETDSPQTERLVVLLHDLFATSVLGTDRATLAMARQNATFRALHSGSWATLLGAMLEDAALLAFLDAGSNRIGAPNENLGREFLERFALGDVEAAYDEATVREAARALTGHAVQDVAGLAFRRRPWDQDRGDKTLFGVRGPHDASDLVALALEQPAAARHLARVWWHAFVSDVAPGNAELEAIAARFRDSDHDLGVLHRATLESEAFWAERHRAALVKSPIDVIVGLARTLEYPKAGVDRMPALLAGLGQSPFAPPDVGGWDEGAAWVALGRLLARFAAVEALLSTGAEPDDSPAMDADASADPAMADATDGAVSLRLASEDLDGPVRMGVTLLADGRATWDSGVHYVPGGHDRARFGPLDASSGPPWRVHRLAAPAAAVAGADEVRVRFVNDAADARGDRNLYVEWIRLGERTASSSSGHQASACVPDNPADAGNLYCAGVLAVPFDAVPAPPARPANALSASAARLRWASHDPVSDRVNATFVLEHLHVPDAVVDAWSDPSGGTSGDSAGQSAGDGSRTVELVQFRLVADGAGRLELRMDSFDCREPCIEAWPACAWSDEHFAASRAVSLPLVPRDADARRCVERELARWPSALLLALEAAAAGIVRHVSDGDGASRHADAFVALRAGLDAALAAGLPDDPTRALAIDPAWAPPPPAPQAPVAVAPRVDSLERLIEALAPLGIDPVALLSPGLEGVPSGDPGTRPGARLRAVLDAPTFQLH